MIRRVGRDHIQIVATLENSSPWNRVRCTSIRAMKKWTPCERLPAACRTAPDCTVYFKVRS